MRARPGPAWWRWVAGCALALAVLAVALRLAPRLALTGDLALLQVQQLDAARGAWPLVGAYSRFGWHHPGPAFAWLGLPLFLLTGGHELALFVTAALVAVGSAAGAVAVVGREAGRAAALAVSVGLVVLLMGRPEAFTSTWNPLVTWLPLGLLLALLAARAGGDERVTPWAVAVASWEVQCHVAYAPVVAALVVAVPVLAWWGARWAAPPGDGPRGRWWVAPLVGLVFWAPPLWEQATRTPGNLTEVARFFLSAEGPTHTAGEALAVLGRVLSRPFHGNVYNARVEGPGTGVGAAAVLAWLALAGWAGWRAWVRRSRFAFSLLVLAVVAVGAGSAAVTRVRSAEVFLHYVAWLVVPAGLVVALALGEALRRFESRWPRPAVQGGALAFALSAGCAVALAHPQPEAGVPLTHDSPARTLDEAAWAHLEGQGAAHLVPVGDAWGLAAGVMAYLEGRGVRVTVQPPWPFDARREASESPAPHLLVTRAEAAQTWARRTDVRVLATAGEWALVAWDFLAAARPRLRVGPAGAFLEGAEAPALADGEAPLAGTPWNPPGCLETTAAQVGVPPVPGLQGVELVGDHNETWELRCVDGEPLVARFDSRQASGMQPHVLLVRPDGCRRLALEVVQGDGYSSLCEVAFLGGPVVRVGALALTRVAGALDEPGRALDGVTPDAGTAWDSAEALRLSPGGWVEVEQGAGGRLCLLADHNDAWDVRCLPSGEATRLEPVDGFGLARRCTATALPPCARLRLSPVDGDGSFSVGEVWLEAPPAP